MTGGGLRQLEPGLSNADAIAHAVIGAARALGLDPVTALTTTDRSRASPARCVPAAINALCRDKADRVAISRILGRPWKAVENAGLRKTAGYVAAGDAARKAVAAAAVKAKLAWAQPIEPEPESAPETEVAIEPAPPPAPQPRPEISRSAGPLMAHLAPPPHVPRPPLPVGSLSDRILQALARGPRNTQSLATELDAKELVVSQCLNALRHERRVLPEVSNGGNRPVVWLAVPGEAP